MVATFGKNRKCDFSYARVVQVELSSNDIGEPCDICVAICHCNFKSVDIDIDVLLINFSIDAAGIVVALECQCFAVPQCVSITAAAAAVLVVFVSVDKGYEKDGKSKELERTLPCCFLSLCESHCCCCVCCVCLCWWLFVLIQSLHWSGRLQYTTCNPTI